MSILSDRLLPPSSPPEKVISPIFSGDGLDLTGADAPELFEALFNGSTPTLVESLLPEIWIEVGNGEGGTGSGQEFFPFAVVPPVVSQEPSLLFEFTAAGRTDVSAGVALLLTDEVNETTTMPDFTLGVGPYTENGGGNALASFVIQGATKNYINHQSFSQTSGSNDGVASVRFHGGSTNLAFVTRSGYAVKNGSVSYVTGVNTPITKLDYTNRRPGLFISRHGFGFSGRYRIKRLRVG